MIARRDSWIWLAPALGFLGVYFILPLMWLAVDAARKPLQMPANMGEMLANTLAFLVVMPLASLLIGLGVLLGTRRHRFGRILRLFFAMPLLINLIGAAAMWRFVFAYLPEGQTQIGALNALLQMFDLSPIPFLARPIWASASLIAISIWSQTGVVVLLLGAALAKIDPRLSDAARLDGASGARVFFEVELAQIRGAIYAVLGLILLFSIKTIDVIAALTGGAFATSTLAFGLFRAAFRPDLAPTIIVMGACLCLLVLPIAWVLRRST